VSRDIRYNRQAYIDDVLNDLRINYPSNTIKESVKKAIESNDVEIIGTVAPYVDVPWDMYIGYISSLRMKDTLSSYLSDDANDILNNKKIKNPSTRYIYLSMLANKYPTTSNVKESILSDIYYDYGLENIPEAYIPLFNTKDLYSPTEIEDSSKVLDILNNGYPLSRSEATSILANLYNTDKDKILSAKIISIAIENGWLSILEKYLSLNNISLSLAYVLGNDIPEISWEYIDSIGGNDSWYRYYGYSDVDKPEDMEPIFWRMLLPKAIMTNNIPLIKSIVNKHGRSITKDMELKIYGLANKYSDDPEYIMSIIRR